MQQLISLGRSCQLRVLQQAASCLAGCWREGAVLPASACGFLRTASLAALNSWLDRC